eukprot:6209474-Pleurochrysis_carterae.AAC.2
MFCTKLGNAREPSKLSLLQAQAELTRSQLLRLHVIALHYVCRSSLARPPPSPGSSLSTFFSSSVSRSEEHRHARTRQQPACAL